MGKTNIEWATHSINFYTWACRQMSPGCENCYARAMAQRYGSAFKPGQERLLDGRTYDGTPDFAAAAARFTPPYWQMKEDRPRVRP
ncbi:MAG: phage Gp37/Gp68 family protein [Anaerolineae bacterium]|nr:phage Gp37/Gp68 family protein [Anaerolineae bacterium]NUQ05950.1 DUF5131 family protein [Anaerolineae bacterium]